MAVEAWCANPWTTREAPRVSLSAESAGQLLGQGWGAQGAAGFWRGGCGRSRHSWPGVWVRFRGRCVCQAEESGQDLTVSRYQSWCVSQGSAIGGRGGAQQGPGGSGIAQHRGQRRIWSWRRWARQGKRGEQGQREEAARRRDTSRTSWGHRPDDTLTTGCPYVFLKY